MRPSSVIANRMLCFMIVRMVGQLKEQDWLLGFWFVGVVDTY